MAGGTGMPTSALGAPAVKGSYWGASNVMPNGMSSGDISVAGNVMTPTPAIKSSGQTTASLMGGGNRQAIFGPGGTLGGGPMPEAIPLLDPSKDPRGVPPRDFEGGVPMQAGQFHPRDPSGVPMPAGNAAFKATPTSGKGGTSTATPAVAGTQPTTPAPQYAPVAPQQQGFNVNQASASALQQAMAGTQQAMGFQPQAVRPTGYQAQTAEAQGYRPSAMTSQGYGASTVGQTPSVTAQNVQAGQLAGSNLGAYTNPYESQVVDQALGDIERSRLMAANQLGAQASAAGAFGGSRQGIAEAETNRAFADQAARTASGLRQAGFTQAQQMAQADIATAQQAALANQQAQLQAGTTTAGLTQQSNLANQAALNAASQFGSSAANQAAAANMAAQNQAAQFGSTAANQMALANVGALNQAGQFGATQGMSAQLANQAAQMQANQASLGAASQMGQLGQQAFQTGQTIQQQQQQAGLLQQGIQQALIDAAKQQYAGYTGAPQQALQAPLAALGVTPTPQTTTNSMQPGLLSYLQIPGLF